MAAEGQCRVTREEARRILRRLELDAYSAIVTAFRAQGDLSKTKKGLLQELASFLCISTERHRAEVRRVVSDDRLNSIAEAIHGYNTEADWTMEGKRLVSLMPRLVPQTALTAKATIQSNSATVVNAKAAAKALESKNAAVIRETQKESQAKEITSSGTQAVNNTDAPKVKKKKKVQSNSTKSSSLKNNIIVTPKIVTSGGFAASTKSNNSSPLKFVGSSSKFHSKPIILQRNTAPKSIRIENALSPITTTTTSPLVSSISSTSIGKEGSFQEDTSSLTNELSQFVRKSQLSFRPPVDMKKATKVSRPKQVTDFAEKKFGSSLTSSFSSHLDGVDILAPPQSFPMAPISPVKTHSSSLPSSQLHNATTVKLIKLPKSVSGTLTSSPVLGTNLTKSPLSSASDDSTKSPVQRMLTLANVQASLGQHNVGKLISSSQGAQNSKLISVTKSVPVAAGFKMIAVTTIVAGTTQVRTVYIATPIMSLTKTISQITSNVITTPAALSGRTSTGPLHPNLMVSKLPSTTSMQKLVTSLTGVSMPNLITCLANGTMTLSPPVTTCSVSSASSPVTAVLSTPKGNPPSCLSSLTSLKSAALPTVVMTTHKGGDLSEPKQSVITSSKEVTDTNSNRLSDKLSLPHDASSKLPLSTAVPVVNPTTKALTSSTKSEYSVVLSDALSTAITTKLLFNTSTITPTSMPMKITSDPVRPIVHCSPAIPSIASKDKLPVPETSSVGNSLSSSPKKDKKSDVDSILLAGEKFLEELKAKQLAAARSLQNGNATNVCKAQGVIPALGMLSSPTHIVSNQAGRSNDPVVQQLDLCSSESLDDASDLSDHLSSACHESQMPATTQSLSTIADPVKAIINETSPAKLLDVDKHFVPAAIHPQLNSASEIGTSGAVSTDKTMDSLKYVRETDVTNAKLPIVISTPSPIMPCTPITKVSLSVISQPSIKSDPHSHLVNDVNERQSISNAIDHPSVELPLHNSQNNDALAIAGNVRKRKGPGEGTAARQISGWIRSAIVLLQKVSRYRGAHKSKGELNAAAWFIRPVDPKDAPGYFKLIKHPMDFGTVKKKLESGQYKEYSEFYTDMQLIKTNCHTYNPPEHVARKDCDAVFEYFETEYQKLLERWHRCHVSPSKKQKVLTGESLNRIETEQ